MRPFLVSLVFTSLIAFAKFLSCFLSGASFLPLGGDSDGRWHRPRSHHSERRYIGSTHSHFDCCFTVPFYCAALLVSEAGIRARRAHRQSFHGCSRCEWYRFCSRSGSL